MTIKARQTSQGVRYDVRLRTPDGRQYKRTFRTRKEADTFRAHQLTDQSRGGWVDPTRSTVTLRVWAHEWLSSDPAKRPSTLARDESVLRLHLLPVLADRTLASLTPTDIQRLVGAWSERSAPRTVRRQYDVVRALLHAAVETDRLSAHRAGASSCRRRQPSAGPSSLRTSSPLSPSASGPTTGP